MKDAGVFAFAGLWERWHDRASGVAVESCCIITTEASSDLAEIHHRMPVILDGEAHATWLDLDASRPLLQSLLKPYREGATSFRAVSRRLNKVANDDPDVQLSPEEAGDAQVQEAADAKKAPPKPSRQGELF